MDLIGELIKGKHKQTPARNHPDPLNKRCWRYPGARSYMELGQRVLSSQLGFLIRRH
jgi:hypothetical protein